MAMEKTFDAASREPQIYQRWEEAGAFKAGANARPGAEPFCIMLPPPNVTGFLHAGHAFNHTLMDILTRWKRMQGYDVLWQPGTDHAGIATQLVVERQLAEAGLPSRRELGREAFLAKVWEWKNTSGNRIMEQDKRLGASMDWSRQAFTMSGAPGDPQAGQGVNFHAAVLKVFVELYNKGMIYRGKRLVNWDPHFETAISDLEVESTEVDGHMWHFKYPLAGGETYTYIEKDEDGNIVLEEERDYISIATTRPETMLGDGAVAVHPSDERYAPIVGKLCEIPVGPKEHRRLVPIITDEYPDPDFGSGAVKITGAHDFNDYAVAKRNGIPLYVLMDSKARMRADGLSYEESALRAGRIARGEEEAGDVSAVNLVPGELRGLDRYEARKQVIEAISREGLAVMVAGEEGPVPYVEAKNIMQPFGDRSKVVIEPMLTDQWFVDAAQLVGPALDAVRNGDVKILPESGEKVYFNWLENIEPWCISRQLWWGHRIPVWYDENGEAYCAASEAEAQAMAPGKTLTQETDVLDTWFSSGLWPIGTLGWPGEEWEEMRRYHPTSVLVTGQDILFFWVARMMMMQIALVGEKPFDTVYLHGMVRDSKGKKMSKTAGNVIDPLDIVDEFGADALRFTNAAMASLGGALKLDTDRIKGYRNFTTKLWNAARFAEMNDALGAQATPPEAQATVNRWIIGECARVRKEVDQALAAFRFNDCASALYAFVWGKVCDWYVEFAKPLLQGDDAAARDETRATMAWVLDQCLILLHPIMPFITEELWETLGRGRAGLLALTDWPDYGEDLIHTDADREMNWVIALIDEIRSVRAQMRVPAGAKVKLVVSRWDDAALAAYKRNEALIHKLARVNAVSEVDTIPGGCAALTVTGADIALPLAGLIDIDAEIGRLEKNLGKIMKEADGLKKRLNNPKFTASAPPEVVEESRATLALRLGEAEQLSAALTRLQGLGPREM